MGLNLAPVAALEGWGEPGGVRLSARVEESPATSSGIPPAYRPVHFYLSSPHRVRDRVVSCCSAPTPCVFGSNEELWLVPLRVLVVRVHLRSRGRGVVSVCRSSTRRAVVSGRGVGGAPLSSVPRVTLVS